MKINMKLSDLPVVHADDDPLVLLYTDAPQGFRYGLKPIGVMLTLAGTMTLYDYKMATPLYGGELMMFDGATLAFECGGDAVAYDYNCN